ncbi:MAG: hypothetical protein QXV17_13000 [Candidatus Micrarchaeaceae archaeon]
MRIRITDDKAKQFLSSILRNISYPQAGYSAKQIEIKGRIIDGIDGLWIEIEEMSWAQR